MSIGKAKAALESCNGMPVSGAGDMALLAIANALVAIAERESKPERIECESRWAQMFGTPERAAQTWIEYGTTDSCADCPICHDEHGVTCELPPRVCAWVDEERGYEALIEWLRGDA